MSHHEYINDRLIERCEGYCVIVPKDHDPAVPLACPVCDFLLRSRDDEEAWRELQCCHLCALRWAHARRKDWIAGWRPSSEELAAVIEQRPTMAVVFDVD